MRTTNQSKGPNFGSGKFDAITSKTMGLSSTMPSLALSWSPREVPGETQNEVRTDATITYVKGSKLLTIAIGRTNFIGTELADLTYVITGGAAKTPWTSVTASGTATALTIKDVMDLLNEIPGLRCQVLHAPYALSFNSETAFASIAKTNIPQGMIDDRLETMFGVDAVTLASYLRIGALDVFDAGALQVLEVSAKATGVTDGTIDVYRDDYDAFGEDIEYYEREILLAARTNYLGYDKLNAPDRRGSIIVAVASDDLTAIDLQARYIRASMGA